MHVGGAEKLVVEELTCLKDDPRFAFELHLVFDRGPFFDSVASLELPIHVWNAPHKSLRMLKNYYDIIRYLRRSRCDILHNHLLDWIGPVVGRLAGVRVVATVHSDKPYSTLEKLVLATSDLVLACGSQVKNNICKFVPAGKVGILDNAICTPENKKDFCRDNVLKKFGIKAGNKLVISLGRFTSLKGFDVLVEAFRRVVSEMPDAILLIGGDGEEKDRLIKLVEYYGLGKNIILPGMVMEVHELLAACDLYVNSSRWEGLPMTLLEAMAHGKPMVATKVGGNPEVVHEGITGILVPPEDHGRLADAIIRMLKDDGLRGKAGTAALALFTQKYTIDKHCETLAEYYMQMLHKKTKPQN
jgi:glycosyltransferase involved in cell wall biosynthesis